MTISIKFKTVLIWIALFFIQLAFWILQKFGKISFEQFFFHLALSIEGIKHADIKLISTFILQCLILPTIIIFFIKYIFRYYPLPKTITNIYIVFSLTVLSFIFLLYKISFFLALNSYIHYIKTHEDYFAENYLNPNQVVITPPAHYKNLVLIYVESLEDSYANKDLFSRNLLASLQSNTISNSYHFEQYMQAPGTKWTIAGIIATQCGLPLKLMGFMPDAGNNEGKYTSGFLNNVTCLGNILAKHGYKNVFMNGPDLSFSGMGKFILTHGYDEAYGRSEWHQYKADDMNYWGLYDDDLFAEGRKKIDQLMSHPNTPFNLTLLTVDTHGPNGFVSKYCAKAGIMQENFEGIVECTALQVRAFINYMNQKGYLKNTTVIVFGDHLAMKNPVSEKLLNKDNKRYIFNLFINNNLLPNRTYINGFDMYPSILYTLGFRFDGGKLGLGYSGFGHFTEKPTIDYYNEMQEKLLGYSPSYSKLWDK